LGISLAFVHVGWFNLCTTFHYKYGSLFERFIEGHLTIFSELYGSKWNVRLRPKHHLLVHLPEIVLKSGPLVGMSCMRYELKNAFFKRCSNTICNFTNISFTLARRHQQHVLFSVLSSAHICCAVVVGQLLTLPVKMLSFSDLLGQKFSVEATDDITLTNKINVASVQYAKGHCVVIDCTDDGLLFSRIVTFVCNNIDEWHMAVKVMRTHEFCYHFHVFVVGNIEPSMYIVQITENQLTD
jgi:hypothetical protein